MQPFISSIENEAMENTYFRRVLFTGNYAQLVVMCLQQSEEIGNEVHESVDQFFRIEYGEAKVVINNGEETHVVREGGVAFIPAGTYHNVINNSDDDVLKFYTIYSPPNHPDGTIHETKMDADQAEGIE